MTHWKIHLVKVAAPFDEQEAIVEASTIVEAFGVAAFQFEDYYARSAQYYHASTEQALVS